MKMSISLKKFFFYNLEIINEENKLKNGNNKSDENILIKNNNNDEIQIKKRKWGQFKFNFSII